MEYRAEARIDADRVTVMDVLTDGDSYADWDNGVVRVEGSIADGETIKVFSDVSPDRAFPVEVSLDPDGMTWTGGMPLGLFRGVRRFDVEDGDGDGGGGGTRVLVEERFSGPLRRVMARQMPDLQPSFDHFARGLKSESERRAG